MDYPLCYFKEVNSDEWKINRLREVFVEEDVGKILQVRPLGVSPTQKFLWVYNSNGQYTVKSGYWLWSQEFSENKENQCGAFGPNLNPLFKQVWLTNTMPKVQHFMWRCLHNYVAVAQNMAKKRLIGNPGCGRCGAKVESVNHVLFTCPYAKLVWALSPLAVLYLPEASDSLFQNMAMGLIKANTPEGFEKELLELWPWIIWRLWKSRNEFCFNGVDLDARDVLDLARSDLSEWSDAFPPPMPRNTQPPRLASGKWDPPPPDFLKCNIDAAWKEGQPQCGVGWILRNNAGEVRWFGAKSYPMLKSSLEAEATALSWAMNVLDNMGMRDVVFEMDCSNLITTIGDPKSWPRLSSFVSEFLKHWRHLKPRFRLVKREKNEAADSIAQHISSSSP